MVKILVVSNLYPPETIGGYEIQCSQAVDYLRARGHEVVVLTSIPHLVPADHPGHVLRMLRTPDVYSKDRVDLRSPYWELESNLINPDNVYVLLEVLREFSPDVCYLWNLVAVGGAGIVGALEYVGMPWVWHLGDSVPAMLCNFDGQLRGMAQAVAPRLTGRFLACSQTVVDTTQRIISLEGRYRIVPNWVTHAEGQVSRRYSDGTSLKLIHAGRLTEDKGTFLLLDAARLLCDDDGADFSLELVGDGEIEELRDRVSVLKLDDRVRFAGRLSQHELRERLRQSDLFLFPTYAEDPMPLAPIEAAALGCVPIIPLLSGVSEWLIDGVDCIKAERSAPAFAAAVRRVMEGDIALEPLAKRAAQGVHNQFSIEKVMPTVEAELVSASSRHPEPVGRPSDAYTIALIGHGVIRRRLTETDSTARHPCDDRRSQ
jgi:glycogen(starch) synthase